ncbi:metal-dependent hydrolase [Pseudoalteromonas luteoviolacea]|uniref:metal-dependent hydrolase n=1 Tax=Pseudoalteromonas luteoviolacea TaxID=43657 RepID=UPI001B359756|nr:metal-dependent hydrolase [Pseudoalteromonas luteoviolacea]MBQ4811119.1 metal-dependent hydrolase [Pseudoalteromonas luteoviolacea]
MANFSTHLKASTIVSATFSSVLLSMSEVSGFQALGLFIVGALAGLLPDLDSDKSKSLNSLFSIFAILVAGILLLNFQFNSIIETWVLGLSVYLLFMFVIKPIFEHFTVHRATLHSLSAVCMFGLLTFHSSLLLGVTLHLALLCSIFVFIGALTHLVLDECYSVDIDNKELKASFGTTLKPIDLRYPFTSLAQVGITLGCVYFAMPYFSNISDIFNTWVAKLHTIPFLPNLSDYEWPIELS